MCVPGMADRTVASVVGEGEYGGQTLGEMLDGADAYVIRGSGGSAILLGSNFYGANWDQLNEKEWREFIKQRGSILLHELLHVYDPTFKDAYILFNWAAKMFVGGNTPAYGGSHWISIWINNDCQPLDPSKPGTY